MTVSKMTVAALFVFVLSIILHTCRAANQSHNGPLSEIPVVFSGISAARRVTSSVRFRRQADIPNQLERHESVFASVEGKFVVALGRGTKDTVVFDQSTNTWERKGPSPFGDDSVHHCQAVGWRGRIVLIGCLKGGFPEELPLRDLYYYFPNTDTWTKFGRFPTNRNRGSTAVVVRNGIFYVINGSKFGHGRGTTETVNWFDSYNPAKRAWRQLPNSPRRRDHGGAVYFRRTDEIFVGGGRWGGQPDFAARENAWREMDVYSFATDSWSVIPQRFQVAHPGNTPEKSGRTFVLCGGEIGSRTAEASLCEFFDMATKTFKFRSIGLRTRERHGTGFARCSTNRNVICVATGAERAPRNRDVRHSECMILNSRKPAVCQPNVTYWT